MREFAASVLEALRELFYGRFYRCFLIDGQVSLQKKMLGRLESFLSLGNTATHLLLIIGVQGDVAIGERKIQFNNNEAEARSIRFFLESLEARGRSPHAE